MRPFEWLISAALLPVIFWSIHPQWPVWMAWCGVAAAMLFLLHGCFEGVHWQMGPAYLAVALMFVTGSTSGLGVQINGIVLMGLGIVSALLLMASVAASYVLPMFRLPKLSGRYPVGTRTLNFVDPDREEMHSWARAGKREVVVQLWYPATTGKGKKAKYRRRKETTLKSSYQAVLTTDSIQDAPVADGRFPVIVHNPAWHGSRQRSTFLAQELASHGFVIAAISHPYNSSFVELLDGTVVHPDYGQDVGFSSKHYISLEERDAMVEEELAIQTRDCRMVLDELERLDRTSGHPLEGHLNLAHVGSYGHSFGGAVSAELATEDPRVLAVLMLDGVLHGATAKDGLPKPLMLIDSLWMVEPDSHHDGYQGAKPLGTEDWRMTAHRENQQRWKTIAENKQAVLEKTGGLRLVCKGLGHTDFTDQIFMSPIRRVSQAGELPATRAARILTSYALAFFQKHLMELPSSLLSEGVGTFPEARLEVWSGS